ncbi:peptide/nickel transport system ATP-binding protein [Actinocorallia herbida]|uniref:Peptide/nickel transport system ATP-binding protein n=1 Tax=Actinocorallia herbida TaxID=58109 RepID=A0A3N1CWX4_9ACTN|nr:ABC transporter ATP-binding protein [Actinocorallia herbida]ROO85802.1 peptide/nickel transport system ATP-binding protein [Actinocorallia herbida]
MTAVLEVGGLRVEAETAAADLLLVDGADLRVGNGEIVGIVGESGCGKSTLVRTLIGMLEGNVAVAAGEVRLGGDRVLAPGHDVTASVRGARVGTVFQDAARSLDPLFKIGYQLREVLARHRPGLTAAQAAEKSAAVLGRMGITEPDRVLGSYPHQLSGGLRQRVAIALAVITDPELVLADECTTALDVTTQAEVVALFRDLVRDTGVGLVFVTHDLLLASDLCDRIAVMYGGQIVEAGPTARVLESPRHPFTAGLLASVPSRHTEGPLVGIPGAAPRVTTAFQGCRFADRCAAASAACADDVGWTGADDEGVRCRHPLDGAPHPPTGQPPTTTDKEGH